MIPLCSPPNTYECIKFLSENLSRKVSRADRGSAKITELRKISVDKISVRIIPLEKMFSCRQRGLKMAELRKDSVKNLRLYHLPSKKFLVPKKGVLKWPSCETNSVKNIRLYSS